MFQVFKVFLSYAVIMMAPFIFMFAFRLAGVDTQRWVQENIRLVLMGIWIYIPFVALSFFLLQDWFLKFPPKNSIEKKATEFQVKEDIRQAFSAQSNNTAIYDVYEQDGRLFVSFSAEIFYNQVLAIGKTKKKSVFALTFLPDKKEAYVITKEKDVSWRASTGGAGFDFSYQKGISLGYETEIRPTLKRDDSGSLTLDVATLKFNTDEIFSLIQEVLNNNGWTLRVNMLPKKSHRAIFIFGITLLAGLLIVPMSIIFKSKKIPPTLGSERPRTVSPHGPA